MDMVGVGRLRDKRDGTVTDVCGTELVVSAP